MMVDYWQLEGAKVLDWQKHVTMQKKHSGPVLFMQKKMILLWILVWNMTQADNLCIFQSGQSLIKNPAQL